MFTTAKTTLVITAALITWALSSGAAQDDSPVLHSLPAEVQKNIEDTRAACREAMQYNGIDRSQSISPMAPEMRWVSSGGEGLIQFTVSGAQAVMVSNHELCGRQCIKGATCSTVGSYDINIYVRTGHAWRNALSTRAAGDVFLSTVGENNKLNALVLSVSGVDKNCHVQNWKEFCDMVIKWDGKKFTYKPL
jgi:hypothetical protein